MDFIRILRSLEELLYEVMTWIVFYPRTLWRSAVAPLGILRYARKEMTDAPDQQYTETLSPVLFLMISLGLSHALNQAIAPDVPALQGLMAQLMSSEQNQLITRSVAFAIFPLIYAIQELRRLAQPLDQNSLRAPFYGQCFVTAVFALVLGLSVSLLRVHRSLPQLLGLTLLVGSMLWYLVVQAYWVRERSGASLAVGVWLALYGFVKASVIVALAALALSFTS